MDYVGASLIKTYRQQPVIRNCRVEGLLKLAHLAISRVSRQASAHESATAHTGGRCPQL